MCFFWGTTYLAIRMAIETFPPVLLVGVRFTLSGAVLLLAARLLRIPWPSHREMLYSAAFGVLALGGGNGCLTYAELWIPSGLAALLVTTSPFWMVGIEAFVPGGERLHRATAAGMLIGLAGTALLVGPDAWREGLSGAVVRGFLLLQAGCITWSLGSIAQRRHTRQVNAIVSGGIQQLAAGIAFLAPALLLNLRPTAWTVRGGGAVLYLVLFGSIIGYTSYVYALGRLPVAIVATYTYVNPVVAAGLGWLFYREPFGLREVFGMLVIFAGLAVVKRFGSAPPADAPLRPATPSPEPWRPSSRRESAGG